MPCLDSSSSTPSVEGGLRPKGSGSHGLLIASFTTLSTTSSACKRQIAKEIKFHVHIWSLVVCYPTT